MSVSAQINLKISANDNLALALSTTGTALINATYSANYATGLQFSYFTNQTISGSIQLNLLDGSLLDPVFKTSIVMNTLHLIYVKNYSPTYALNVGGGVLGVLGNAIAIPSDGKSGCLVLRAPFTVNSSTSILKFDSLGNSVNFDCLLLGS